jgi:hypothetical protein
MNFPPDKIAFKERMGFLTSDNMIVFRLIGYAFLVCVKRYYRDRQSG